MNPPFARRLLSLAMINVFLAAQVFATCGGGGGGGMGGMSGGTNQQQIYLVPWKLIQPTDQIKDGLSVYWFPTGADEVNRSSLRESRTLQLYAQQCVTMGLADVRTAMGPKYVPDGKLPVVVMVQPDGTVVGKLF